MGVVDSSFDQPLKLEERAAASLAGGLMNHGYQCGMIWGAALAAGAQAYRLLGPGPQAETAAVIEAQRLVEAFRARNKNINCLEITDMNMQGKIETWKILKFFLKAGPIHCLFMAAGYAPEVFNEINVTLSEKHNAAPHPPVSCAAMLAKKAGESDMHQVMAAGFAGGIGLSGGACGALGTAVWIIEMNRNRKEIGKVEFDNPMAMEAIEGFLKCSDFEFECSKITGRMFENADDHAGYMRAGGCSKIIETLAAHIQNEPSK